MPVVVPGLALSLVLILSLFVAISLQRTLQQWQQPTFTGSIAASKAKGKASRFWTVTKSVLNVAKYGSPAYWMFKGLEASYKYAYQHVSRWTAAMLTHYAAGAIKAVVQWINSLATIAYHVPAASAALAEATYKALYTLRHVSVPRMIDNALTPVEKLAARAWTRADWAADELTTGAGAVAGSLTSLGWITSSDPSRALNNFGDAFANLWRYTRNTLADRVTWATTVAIPDLQDQVGKVLDDLYGLGADSLYGIRSRLRAVEDALAGIGDDVGAFLRSIATETAFAAAVVAAITAFAPNLFCRNTRGVTSKLCGLDENMLAGLLAGTLTLAVALDPRLLARLAQETAEGLEGIIRETADL